MFIKCSSKNLIKMDENGYVMAFKDLFGISSRDEFPDDFDAWDVKKQFDWLNQNIEKFFPNVPQSLLSFIPAAFCELNYDQSLEELPEWMDMEYVSTLKRILNWYNGDPWIKGTEAYKDMQVTRGMHLAIRRKVCQMDHEQITTASTFANPWCPDREVLLKDFAVACPPEKFGQRPYITSNKSSYKPKGVNNADLSGVQSGFVVMSLLYPESIGIHNATDEDLEAFAHMWRCYGYYLGLEDEYNFCRGSLEEIKQRLRDFYQYWIIQNLKEMTPEWEHITRCLVVHANYYPLLYMPYKAMALIATDALNLKMPHLYASLNYAEWIAYKSYKFIFYSLKFSIVRTVVNKIMHIIIDKASNFNTEKLADIHKKSNKVLPDFSLTYE